MSKDGLKMHIVELKHKHHNIELEINELINSHGDDTLLQELKKRKLALKDEIAGFESQLEN